MKRIFALLLTLAVAGVPFTPGFAGMCPDGDTAGERSCCCSGPSAKEEADHCAVATLNAPAPHCSCEVKNPAPSTPHSFLAVPTPLERVKPFMGGTPLLTLQDHHGTEGTAQLLCVAALQLRISVQSHSPPVYAQYCSLLL